MRTAWHCVSPEVIVKGFKKCCMSSAVDENDDDVLWNGSESDGNVRSWCEEGTDWYREVECDMLCILTV
jgi:hypothetical protein